MRYGFLLLGLLLCTTVRAQLTVDVGADAGARFLPISKAPLLSSLDLPTFGTSATQSLPLTGHRLPTVPYSPPTAFDFTRTRPHLAFFCRLEINETRGSIIPMKFRLGGHRAWQDELLR